MSRIGGKARGEGGGAAMTMRFTFTANAAAVIAAVMVLLIFGSVAAHSGGSVAARSGPIAGSAQYNLQQQQQEQLKSLSEKYQEAGSAPGADQEQLRWQYLNEAHDIKQNSLAQDTRGQMIDDLVQQHAQRDANGNPVLDKDGKIVSDIENTGSAPKDVRSDVDLNAKTPEAAQNAIDGWQSNNHVLEGPDGQELSSIDWNNPPYKVVDRTTDTTLWLPCKTQACLDAKALDTDAWTTEGGLEGTGNSGRVRDPYGYYLDNEKKFAHGQDALDNLLNGDTSDMTLDDALKTVAKSLDKAAELAGIKDNSELWAQVDALRNYANPVEAGIADPGDPPDVVIQKLQAWLQTVEPQMLQAKGVLSAAGETTAAARAAAEEALLSSNPADPDNVYQNALGAGESANQRALVDASNATAERVNSGLGGIGQQPPPDAGTPQLPSGGPYQPAPNSGFTEEQLQQALTPPGPGTYKPPSASSFQQQQSLPEQLGATSTNVATVGEGLTRAGVGAGTGAIVGAAMTYAACVATVYTTGNGSEKECHKAANASVPDSLLWGAVAALSPWGEVIAAVYGGYQSAKQIGTALGEGSNMVGAMANEAGIKQTSQLLQPINNAVLGCNFGAALLMAQRFAQDPGFAKLLPNLPPLVSRLQSEVNAAGNVNALLGQANKTSNPAQRQQLLNQALAAAGKITCLQNRVASSSPQPSPATATAAAGPSGPTLVNCLNYCENVYTDSENPAVYIPCANHIKSDMTCPVSVCIAASAQATQQHTDVPDSCTSAAVPPGPIASTGTSGAMAPQSIVSAPSAVATPVPPPIVMSHPTPAANICNKTANASQQPASGAKPAANICNNTANTSQQPATSAKPAANNNTANTSQQPATGAKPAANICNNTANTSQQPATGASHPANTGAASTSNAAPATGSHIALQQRTFGPQASVGIQANPSHLAVQPSTTSVSSAGAGTHSQITLKPLTFGQQPGAGQIRVANTTSVDTTQRGAGSTQSGQQPSGGRATPARTSGYGKSVGQRSAPSQAARTAPTQRAYRPARVASAVHTTVRRNGNK
jgi:hypothetical protein